MTNLNSNSQRMEDIIEGKQKKTAPKYVGIIIALVLLAACSFGAYSIGQSSGHTAGYDEGYSTGREEGRKAGNKEGYSTGHDEGYDVGYLAYEHDEPYNSDYEKYPFGWSLEDYDGVGIQSFLDGMNNGYKTGFKAGFNKGWEPCATGKPYLDNMGESYP